MSSGGRKKNLLCLSGQDLVRVLKLQFCPVESLQSLSATFHSWTQKHGESLADFSRNLMRYYSRMEQAAPTVSKRKVLQFLRDTSLKEEFVRRVICKARKGLENQ